jgi:hypothetical protein
MSLFTAFALSKYTVTMTKSELTPRVSGKRTYHGAQHGAQHTFELYHSLQP